MYYVTKKTAVVEEKKVIEYGVADERTEYCFFTQNKDKAENLVKILNECRVEPVHVQDIIEDMFYT